MENAIHGLFLFCGFVSVAFVLLISVYLIISGIPAIHQIGPIKFLFGTTWKSGQNQFGILPFILTSDYGTAGAVFRGIPIGIFTAMFLAKAAPPRFAAVIQGAVELLAGIPSVVYGFFGLMVIVPAVRMIFGTNRTDGMSILTASFLLGIMILPTIIGVTETSIRAVNSSYFEGALALGATKEACIYRCVIPAANSGSLAGVVLGIGRAIGETMAVMVVVGNQARIPNSIFKGVRTLTTNIVIEMGYATDLHREALIATGVVLFVFILIINLVFSIVKGKADKE